MPTASQLRITADILCGSKTFSSTTPNPCWRLRITVSSFSFRSLVIGVKMVNGKCRHIYGPGKPEIRSLPGALNVLHMLPPKVFQGLQHNHPGHLRTPAECLFRPRVRSFSRENSGWLHQRTVDLPPGRPLPA